MIPAPELDFALLSPVLIVAAAALVGVLVEAFCPRGPRFVVQTGLATGASVAALVASIVVYVGGDLGVTDDPGRTVVADEASVITWMMLAVFGLLGVLLFADRTLDAGLSAFTGRAADRPGSPEEAEAIRARVEHTEIFPLAMFALLGMMLFAASSDLLTMFVALEVLSLPLYLLCGIARRRRLVSQEAALKYFVLGAFSSAFFLYGVALAYGYSGSFAIGALGELHDDPELRIAAVALMAVGLLFKVGAVPFHAWTPDVYVGAPTPVTAFMAAGTKAAAFVALMRVLFASTETDWQPVVAVVAGLTMVVGSLFAIAQTDVKRMLAYSSVAHAGFLLTGVLSGSDASAVLFYLITYGLASIGAFAVVMLVRDAGGEATATTRWAGLGRQNPILGVSFAIFMLSFAGIPLTGGFVGKLSVFIEAGGAGYWPVVVLGVVVSAVAAFFYVRMITVMFFTDPDGLAVASGAVITTTVVVVAAIGTVILGIAPGPVLELVQQTGSLIP
ncbi:NADH-quinone oxidoreductase subunit NuoN [Aeromicrobium alkaliterrae]|uniref:NADH-quinone oxidoreductase subunit N n=1 Tax=Aeromicrobium alkaliterrae TaxID=302168 RepID=A0ABN2JVS8_9ACTN